MADSFAYLQQICFHLLNSLTSLRTESVLKLKPAVAEKSSKCPSVSTEQPAVRISAASSITPLFYTIRAGLTRLRGVIKTRSCCFSRGCWLLCYLKCSSAVPLSWICSLSLQWGNQGRPWFEEYKWVHISFPNKPGKLLLQARQWKLTRSNRLCSKEGKKNWFSN